MKEIEISARTVDEAVQEALGQLGVEIDQVDVEVIKKGKTGILGLMGEDARVKVKLREVTQPKNEVTEIARGALETLLKLIGIEARIQVTEDESSLSMNLEGEDLGILIGRRGQTIAHLEYMVRLITAEKLKSWFPIVVDVAGYKKRRREALESLASRLAEKVKLSRRAMTLEPMPPSERRIIHLALTDHPDVSTQSIGEGEARKVVIQPKNK